MDPDDRLVEMRRRSSQIISADQSFKEGLGREREDSITAFKRYDKANGLADYSISNPGRNTASPCMSPSQRSTPQVPTPLNFNQSGNLIGQSPIQSSINNSLQAFLLNQLGAQRFVLPGATLQQ